MPVQLAKSEPVLVQLQQLLLQLHQAVSHGKWLQVQALDRQIQQQVQQLKSQHNVASLKVELQMLTQRYQQLIQLAKKQQQQLEQKMNQFQQNKAGVLAYRQTSEGVGS
ncbi:MULTISPECIES: hypothetical protein [Rheinheimera]|uniref:Flagellar protein FliT n=1 Tax=Rheinheimera marina TaxID=1774958 RepID=A0ABV9JGN2_9GAMM